MSAGGVLFFGFFVVAALVVVLKLCGVIPKPEKWYPWE